MYETIQSPVNYGGLQLKNRIIFAPTTFGLSDEEYLAEMERLAKGRKTGLTFAPEAGTQRLRDVINKGLTEEVILQGSALAFEGGWTRVKLYFMLGHPTETEEDIRGIAELSNKIAATFFDTVPKEKRVNGRVQIVTSTSFFVPKPFTPFQWEAQITPEEYLRRVHLLQSELRSRSIDYRYHESDLSRLEAVMARGDRRLGPVIREAVRLGAKLDGWDEYFRYDIWMQAFRTCGVDPDFYTTRGFGKDELLPWQTLSVGVSQDFLWHEREKAYASQTTPDCRTKCGGCGANRRSERGVCDE